MLCNGREGKSGDETTEDFCFPGLSRYSRQMLVPEIGIQGQSKLRDAKVLVIGCGGLGCPCVMYLAGAGVGNIYLVDHDEVELNNLHRQIQHSETSLGTAKADSLADAVKKLNSEVKVYVTKGLFSRETAVEISNVENLSLILDCSDNPPTRYLVNDIAVLRGVPVVSASALKWEGQLTVYGAKNPDGTNRGPCYRCLFPEPPPQAATGTCSEAGVIGPVPGMLGTMQALEAIKIITGAGESLSQRMFVFDGLTCTTRVIKLRPRNIDCKVCGDRPSIGLDNLPDYEKFCGVKACDKITPVSLLPSSDNVSPQDFDKLRRESQPLLIDVRPKLEFNFCRLAHSINLPYDDLIRNKHDKQYLSNCLSKHKTCYVICHRGNDSQRAIVQWQAEYPSVKFKNIRGGLEAWAETVNRQFLKY